MGTAKGAGVLDVTRSQINLFDALRSLITRNHRGEFQAETWF